METVAIDTTKTWTADEYLQLEENPNQQLINGKLIMSPSPSLRHQQILKNLSHIIHMFAVSRGDRMYFAPVDVHLNNTNIPQPDLVYILKNNLDKLSERGIEGAPDLIIEIISPSNSYIDRYDKKHLYQQHKVKEYWIIDPGNLTLEVYQLEKDEYILAQYLSQKGAINSPLLKDLTLELADNFVSK